MELKKAETLEQLLEAAREGYETAHARWWVFVMFTDELFLQSYTPDALCMEQILKKADKLLELHIFSEEAEYKAFRGNIGGSLHCRIKAEDAALQEKVDYYDEMQYLDIDTTKMKQLSEGLWQVQTTGGGSYQVPLSDPENAVLKVRNYLEDCERSGQVYVSDWRMVSLQGGKGNGTGRL